MTPSLMLGHVFCHDEPMSKGHARRSLCVHSENSATYLLLDSIASGARTLVCGARTAGADVLRRGLSVSA